MYYFNDEERTKAVEKTVAEYRKAAGLFPAVRRVIKKFDGKVFNCRLEKALNEETGIRIYTEKHCDTYLEIYYCGDTYSGGYSRITLARIDLDKMEDRKRIPAALLIESARQCREKHLKDAAEIEEISGQMDELKKQIDYFVSQANRIINGFPYQIRDIYRLRSVHP